jgi:hypothetical protein
MSKEKEILKRAHEARQFLRIHGFLPDKENERIAWRIDKQILKHQKKDKP